MTMKELIVSALEGKSAVADIVDEIVAKFPDESTDSVVKAIDAVKKSLEIKGKLAADAEKKQLEQEEEQEEAVLEEKVAKLVQKSVDSALKSIPATSKDDVVSKLDGTYLKDFVTVGSEYETKKMTVQLFQAIAAGDRAMINELNNKFISGSQFSRKLLAGDSGNGSVLPPDEFSADVAKIVQLQSGMFSRATKESIGSDKKYIPVIADGAFTELGSQATQITGTEPTISQKSMDVVDVAKIVYLTNDLASDSIVNTYNMLVDSFGREQAAYFKRATTVGNVATTGDKVNGIYSTSGITTVASGGSITYSLLNTMRFSLNEAFLSGAHWEMHPLELNAIYNLVDSVGRPIFVDALTNPMVNGNVVGPQGMLLGYPVFLNSQMPATMDSSTGARTGGGSTATIIFGNAQAGLRIGLRAPLEIATSVDFKFDYNQVAYRGIFRWAMVVVQPTAFARLTDIVRA